MEARYTYRLRVNPEETRLLQGVFDVTRFVWNQTLGRWSDLWRYEGERLSYGEASADLTDLRQTFDWLGEQPHVPQQQVIRAGSVRAMTAIRPGSLRVTWQPEPKNPPIEGGVGHPPPSEGGAVKKGPTVEFTARIALNVDSDS